MNKIPLMLLLVFCQIAHGQKKIMVEKLCEEYAIPYDDYEKNGIEIDALNQIPIKHQSIVNEIIKKSMTDFQDNITFAIGRVMNIENDSILDMAYTYLYNLYEEKYYGYVIPKYELYFELTDTLIGIKKYCLRISLDQYGKVIHFDWSREGYNKRTNFIKADAVLEFATKYAKKKKYITSSYLVKLEHNRELDKLCWHISFLQSDEDWNKTYQTIVIDAIKLTVLDEYKFGIATIE